MTLKANWKYLKYVLRHKYYVYVKGREYGLGRWQLLKHDLSKFSPAEWSPYVRRFYMQANPHDHIDFKVAWLHHLHHNPHHWQHWLLQNDDGKINALKMPRIYELEMLADWYGAGMAINGEADVKYWYMKNHMNMRLNPTTRTFVENTLGLSQLERLELLTERL